MSKNTTPAKTHWKESVAEIRKLIEGNRITFHQVIRRLRDIFMDPEYRADNPGIMEDELQRRLFKLVGQDVPVNATINELWHLLDRFPDEESWRTRPLRDLLNQYNEEREERLRRNREAIKKPRKPPAVISRNVHEKAVKAERFKAQKVEQQARQTERENTALKEQVKKDAEARVKAVATIKSTEQQLAEVTAERDSLLAEVTELRPLRNEVIELRRENKRLRRILESQDWPAGVG